MPPLSYDLCLRDCRPAARFLIHAMIRTPTSLRTQPNKLKCSFLVRHRRPHAIQLRP
jgi:hypothetical protein